MNKKTIRTITTISLIIGALLFVIIGAVSAWGDIESTLFNNRRAAPARLTTLRCPPIITTNETGYISALIVNETEKDTLFKVRAFITDGAIILVKEIDSDVPLGPHETQLLEWPVIAENAAFDRMILARVHQLENSPHPYRNSACGIIVIDVPFLTGSQLVTIVMSLGGLFTIGGMVLWTRNSTPVGWRNPDFRKRIFFIGSAFLIAITGLLGLWLLTVLLVVIWILLVIEIIWNSTITNKKSPIEIEKEG